MESDLQPYISYGEWIISRCSTTSVQCYGYYNNIGNPVSTSIYDPVSKSIDAARCDKTSNNRIHTGELMISFKAVHSVEKHCKDAHAIVPTQSVVFRHFCMRACCFQNFTNVELPNCANQMEYCSVPPFFDEDDLTQIPVVGYNDLQEYERRHLLRAGIVATPASRRKRMRLR